MTTFDDFWGRAKGAAPGMFELGAGIYSRNQAQDEAAKRLKAAQGPLYQANMTGAQTALSRAGSMDPKAAAKERFNSAQGLLAGKDAKSEADLMRMLHAKGMLGAANFNPGVEGITPNGTAMNPHMAAFYAAKNARDGRMAYDSLNEGEGQIDRMIKRGGMLQTGAQNAQNMGLQAQRTQPSKSAGNLEMLKGLGGILKDTGMLGMGVDFLKDMFGGGSPLATGGFEVGFGDFWN